MAPEPRRQRIRPGSLALLAGGAAALIAAVVLGAASQSRAARGTSPTASVPPSIPPETRLDPFDMPACQGSTPATADREIGNPQARQSAQRGLDYLARVAAEWQTRNNCYGCHVQAVTVEALSVGTHHRYQVSDVSRREVLRGMLDLPGGARNPGGLGHPSPPIAQSAKILGGAAFARYDQWVDDSLRDFMLVEASAVRAMQETDGHVPMPYTSDPVATGTVQATAQAVVLWKQAYERTADDQWLTAISQAEDYLHGILASWRTSATTPATQEGNYMLMGLLAAGVSPSEAAMRDMSRRILDQQNKDGGWGRVAGTSSDVLATGQTLYTLRLFGLGDSDHTVARGTRWLIEKQREDGSWSDAGFGKAEAMWAVLGLVSIDVLSVSLAGLENGQHLSGTAELVASARDNDSQGGGVRQVELYVDDIRVGGACGASLRYTLDSSKLGEGMHVVEVRARNARGKDSRRILEVYAGNVYLTQVGTRFADDHTEISLRNIAEAGKANTVRMEVFSGVDQGGTVSAGARIYSTEAVGRQGAMSFAWAGEGAPTTGAATKYVARLTFVDGKGRAVQSKDVVFVHDTLEAQRASYGQLEGSLALPGGDMAQNAMVELVDEQGRVVDRTKSTREGKYRFRNVAADKGYKIRISKQGFRGEGKAAPAKGAEQKVDLDLVAE